MRLALELVVITVVLLVVAIVMLSFFVTGVDRARQLTDARNQCIIMGSSSCKSLKIMPPTWNFPSINMGGEMKSCQQLTGYEKCDSFGVTTGEATGGATGGGAATTQPNTAALCIAQIPPGTCKATCDQTTETELGTCESNQKCCRAKASP